MKGSKLFSTLFAVVLILSLTFSMVSADAPPEPENAVQPDGPISVDAYPRPIAPTGGEDVYTKLPVFYFSKDYTANKYRIEVYNILTGEVVYEFEGYPNCTNNVCQLQPDTKLKVYRFQEDGGYYKWRVRSRVIAGTFFVWTSYSAYSYFYVMSKGFDATFDTSPVFNNWYAWTASWTWKTTGKVRTYGLVNNWTTLMRANYYNDFEYTVLMKRKVNISNSNFILIYGDPVPTSDGMFNDGLYFQYRNDEYWSVYHIENGVSTAIQPWTDTDAIVPYGWNELRVLANYPYVDLWINGTYLGWIEMPSISGGYVGFGMYSVANDEPLVVDSAKLTAFYVGMQAEHDPAMQLGLNPVEVTAEQLEDRR